jgi:arylsulfatase A-like enzyme
MDWLPTLLAAAGADPDQRYPPDGMDLLPILTGRVPTVPRKLYWRYKARAQRAMRDGDLKFLKILDHTFLFDLAADPLDRANPTAESAGGPALTYNRTSRMVSHMKTTLNISDAVMKELRREAARQGRTMSELVEAALRLLLRRRREPADLPPLPVLASGGHQVDIADRESLYQAMEGR